MYCIFFFFFFFLESHFPDDLENSFHHGELEGFPNKDRLRQNNHKPFSTKRKPFHNLITTAVSKTPYPEDNLIDYGYEVRKGAMTHRPIVDQQVPDPDTLYQEIEGEFCGDRVMFEENIIREYNATDTDNMDADVCGQKVAPGQKCIKIKESLLPLSRAPSETKRRGIQDHTITAEQVMVNRISVLQRHSDNFSSMFHKNSTETVKEKSPKWLTSRKSFNQSKYILSKHVYMGPIWAESGHLSHSGPAWAPYRLFCPYKTYIGPILVNFDQQTRIYGNHMGRFGAFIPFGSYLGPI